MFLDQLDGFAQILGHRHVVRVRTSLVLTVGDAGAVDSVAFVYTLRGGVVPVTNPTHSESIAFAVHRNLVPVPRLCGTELQVGHLHCKGSDKLLRLRVKTPACIEEVLRLHFQKRYGVMFSHCSSPD